MKKAIENIKWDHCQECDWFISEENEFYDKCDPDPIVTWCGYNNSKNKGYCGLKELLRKVLEDYKDKVGWIELEKVAEYFYDLGHSDPTPYEFKEQWKEFKEASGDVISVEFHNNLIKQQIAEFIEDLNSLIRKGMNDMAEDDTFDLIKKWEEKL